MNLVLLASAKAQTARTLRSRSSLHAILACSTALAGCAGFTSKPIDALTATAAPDGIVYYMPRKPIVIQIAISDDGKKDTLTVPAQSAQPDRSKPFLLFVGDNYIGENHVTLQVGTNGLLQSVATEQTSGAGDLVKALATDAGTFTALAAGAPVPGPFAAAHPCAPSQIYTLVLWPENFAGGKEKSQVCDLTIEVQDDSGRSPLDDEKGDKKDDKKDGKKASEEGTAQPGVFFKTEIPYRIDVKNSQGTQTFTTYSPDAAPIQFMPLKRSFFAKNTTTFSFTDGVLTKAESDVGGEATAAAALPADAISAYTTALGGIFGALSTNTTDQATLAAAKAQLALCRSTIAENPTTGVSADQAAASRAAIQAACGG